MIHVLLKKVSYEKGKGPTQIQMKNDKMAYVYKSQNNVHNQPTTCTINQQRAQSTNVHNQPFTCKKQIYFKSLHINFPKRKYKCIFKFCMKTYTNNLNFNDVISKIRQKVSLSRFGSINGNSEFSMQNCIKI